MLTSYINGYLYECKQIDYNWNPLRFPNTILTFDDVGWNKIMNQTSSDSSEYDNDYIDFLINMIKQFFYDAFGYTVITMNSMTDTPAAETITTPTQYPTKTVRRSVCEGDTDSNKKVLPSESGNEDEYDKFFKGKISSKNRLNYTFGILFNDMNVFDNCLLTSIDINHEYQLLRAVFHQCLYLTMLEHMKHIQLHSMPLSEVNRNNNNADSNRNNGNLINLDIETPKPIENNVMITLNDNYWRNSGEMYLNDMIIEEIITFYSTCLRWKDANNQQYKTYGVSNMETVYFLTLLTMIVHV